jgi:hypothetical protein
MVRMRLMLPTALTLATVFAACGGSGDPADDRTPVTAAEGVRTDQQALVGTWETRSMSTGEHMAAAEAAGCPASTVEVFFADWPYEEAVHAIRFEDGFFTEYARYDGGRNEPGSSGIYQAEDGTMTLIEDVGTWSLGYRLSGDELTFQLRGWSCDDVPQAFIFQGAPFTRVGASAGDAVSDSLEGTWTAVVTAELEERAASEAGIDAAQTPHEELFGGTGPATIVLTFEDGRMIHSSAVEGTEPEVGWSGVYEIVDEDTFVAGDAGDLYIEYTYSIQGDELVIDMVRDDYPAVSEEELAGEIYAQTVIYESAPFTRES